MLRRPTSRVWRNDGGREDELHWRAMLSTVGETRNSDEKNAKKFKSN